MCVGIKLRKLLPAGLAVRNAARSECLNCSRLRSSGSIRNRAGNSLDSLTERTPAAAITRHRGRALVPGRQNITRNARARDPVAIQDARWAFWLGMPAHL